MKEALDIPKNYLIATFSVLAVLTFIAAVILSKNYFKYRAKTNTLIEREIKGVITTMKDENRGSYYLEIKTEKELLSIHSLPLAWEVKKYNIQIGDSVSKAANSRLMFFYKSKNGVMLKMCEFEM